MKHDDRGSILGMNPYVKDRRNNGVKMGSSAGNESL